MEKVAIRLADYLVRTETVQDENKEIYAYGFQVGLELIVAVLTIIICAVVMGMPVECAVLLAVFFAVRGTAGGVHMNSFLSCYFCSVVLVVLALAAVKYLDIKIYVIAVISILSLVIIKCLSPVENDNRPVCDWEREVFARRLNITIAVLIVLESILYMTGNGHWLWCMAVGEMLNVLALTWGKIRYRKGR